MSLNAAEIACIVAPLAAELVDGRVQKVRAVAHEPEAIGLEIRAPGASHRLVVSASSIAARLHRVSAWPQQPTAPPAFVMLLRKRLIGAVLRAVTQVPGDRIVRMTFDARAAEGEERDTLHLVAELTGRHANLFLLNEDDAILQMLLPNKSEQRDLHVNGAYVGPPADPPDGAGVREDWPTTNAEAFLQARYDDIRTSAAWNEGITQIRGRLKRDIRRTRRTLTKIEGDLGKIAEAESFKRRGELLRGAYGAVARGATEVEVTDYFDPELPKVRVPLDPTRDLEANIQSLFHQYRRLRRGEDAALARAEEVESKLETLQALRDRLDGVVRRFENAPETDQADALAELERALDRAGVRKRQAPQRGKKAVERKPYHAFTSSDGLPILVGKGSKDNDALTFHVGRGNDIWLHAADWPGSHVIVRLHRGQEIPQRTLIEAAQLAAHYSKGRGDTVIGVHWTPRKHVKKPKGAPAGRVTLASPKSVDIRPDQATLDRLFQSRG